MFIWLKRLGICLGKNTDANDNDGDIIFSGIVDACGLWVC
jgi:hypothetical protein